MSGRVLYLDPFAGIAGDMLIAALLALGGDLAALRAALLALDLRGYQIRAEAVFRGPFAATRFVVEPDGAAPPSDAHDHSHGHSHSHGHGHDHSHSHSHSLLQIPVADGERSPLPAPDPWAGQPNRGWAQIRAMIGAAALPPRAKARALAVFGRLAEAEGAVHGVPPDEVWFHEVGAVDSIVDIVGACLLLEQLDVDQIVCAPLPMGSGRIHTAHGWIPVPAPATLEVLRGWPVFSGPAGREHVTPTGAALVAALASPGAFPSMVIERSGYGAGTRDPADHPNVVRAVLGRPIDATSPERVTVLEAQMDDLSGEHAPPLLDALFAAGALDAYVAPVLMKKGRPGMLVTALATPARAAEVERALLRHGSTFGVRRQTADRRVLSRRHVAVETRYGPVRIKLGLLDGDVVHAAPEFEDVAAAAKAHQVPVPRVHAAAIAAWGAAEGG